MNDASEPGRAAGRRRDAPTVLAACSVTLGVVVLVGWALDLDTLTRVFPSMVSMKVNAALGFLTGGVALWLVREDRPVSRWAIGLSMAVAAIGGLTLLEYVAGLNLGIDEIFVREPPNAIGSLFAGRMHPTTAFDFLALGVALALIAADSEHRTAHALALLAALIAGSTLVGYLVGVRVFFGVAAYYQMALHTTLGILTLALGVLLARPHRGLMRAITSDGPGGLMARRLIPVAILAPILLNGLTELAYRGGILDERYGLAVRSTMLIAIMVGFIGRNAFTLYWIDLDRKDAEAKRLDSEGRFRFLADAMPQIVWTCWPDGEIEYINRRWFDFTGQDPNQGWDYRPIYHPDDLERWLELRDRAVRAGESFNGEFRFRRADGTYHWRLVQSEPRRDADDRIVQWVYTSTDIEGQKRVEDELRRVQHELEHRVRERTAELERANAAMIVEVAERTRAEQAAHAASQAKSSFLANMSHEVRTPMAAILGYSDMLLDFRLFQAERDHALQAIRRNGSHLLQIINDILDLSKIEAGRLDLELIRYSPWQVALEVASALRIRADEKGVVMETHMVSRLPAFAIMDPTRVRQILMNLVSNAIKFSEPGGRVVIRIAATIPVEGQPATLRLEVEDDGIGMTPTQIEQLFIPFQQADTSTTRKYGGTGLGLSITRRLAEAMGGKVWVRSAIERGSCFTAQIPLQTDDHPSVWLEADELAVHVARTDKRVDREVQHRILAGRVLLAEDNPDNQRVLLYHLCRMGLEVEVVENGRIAVEKALRWAFDLVLMDMQMPELDGYGAISSLRRSGFVAPIIALTAHAMPEDREKCFKAGCTDFLTKPVEANLLADVMAKYLAPQGIDPRADGFGEPGDAIRSEFDHDPGMGGLIREFAERLPGQVDRLRSMLDAQDLRGVESLAHQLRGVGGMYGYSGLTAAASLIEDAIRESQGMELIRELVDEFAEMVAKIKQGVGA